MGRTALCLLVTATGIAGAGAVACTGGSGVLPDFYEGWESDRGERNSREVPGSSMTDPGATTAESPLQSQDPAPGSGGFVCDGIYDCSLTRQGRTVTVKVPLQMKNGVCMAGDEVVLEPNGTARSTDQDSQGETGTWVASGSGFVLLADGQVITCVRSTGGATTEEPVPPEQGGGEQVPNVPPETDPVPPAFDGGF